MTNETTEINPVLIIVLFVPFFVGMWLLVTYILYRISWIHLQRNYRWPSPISAKKLGIISFRHHGVNYKNMIILYTDMQGFYLKAFLPFSTFSKPLFIPWNEVRQIERSRIMFARFVDLKIGLNETQTISFTTRSFQKLEPELRQYGKPQLFSNLS